MMVYMFISVFCDMKPCCLVKRFWRSGGNCCLHIYSGRLLPWIW